MQNTDLQYRMAQHVIVRLVLKKLKRTNQLENASRILRKRGAVLATFGRGYVLIAHSPGINPLCNGQKWRPSSFYEAITVIL